MAVNGGKVWAMHQAVESFTDQLFVCVCVCWFMYEWRVVINCKIKKTFSDVLTSAVIKEKRNIVFSLVKFSDGN